ncbi:plasmolipin-like isoform X1 [Lineus longissimus]|uniref:plasmolipin-like isoform X1 n=1 Tax=Lineus longissimus TaxID=88925 RepID=UPI002B4CECED
MTDMPTTYETKTSSHVESGHTDSTQTGCYTGYIRTIPGILKIVEMVLDLIVIICCACIVGGGGTSGWGTFLAASAIITTAILFIFHITNLISRLPGPWLVIEFAYFVIYAALYVITAIVCAAFAGTYISPASGAAAFFAFAAAGVYGVDAFLMFRTWRAAGSPVGRTESTQATTTTTVTTVETAQY